MLRLLREAMAGSWPVLNIWKLNICKLNICNWNELQQFKNFKLKSSKNLSIWIELNLEKSKKQGNRWATEKHITLGHFEWLEVARRSSILGGAEISSIQLKRSSGVRRSIGRSKRRFELSNWVVGPNCLTERSIRTVERNCWTDCLTELSDRMAERSNWISGLKATKMSAVENSGFAVDALR